jgi:hypothetical protein
VPGWTSLMVVTSLIGSALLVFLGVLGQYVSRVYEQSKGRPLYIVSRAVNCRTATPEGNLVATGDRRSNDS